MQNLRKNNYRESYRHSVTGIWQIKPEGRLEGQFKISFAK